MMENAFSFRREGGLGWIVLSGATPTLGGAFSVLAEQLLTRADLSRPAASFQLPGVVSGEVDAFVEEIEVLLSFPVARLDSRSLNQEVFLEAGLVLLGGGTTPGWLGELLGLQGGPFSASWLAEGTVLLASGPPSGVLGSWTLTGNVEAQPALGWLPEAVVLPGLADPAEAESVREFLSTAERRYALGLSDRTALALGPAGEVEVWSEEPPRLLFSRGWMEG